MTKQQLMLALQGFPDTATILIQVGGARYVLDHVEMAVDSSPVVVEAKSGGESWQQLLAARLQITLVPITDRPDISRSER